MNGREGTSINVRPLCEEQLDVADWCSARLSVYFVQRTCLLALSVLSARLFKSALSSSLCSTVVRTCLFKLYDSYKHTILHCNRAAHELQLLLLSLENQNKTILFVNVLYLDTHLRRRVELISKSLPPLPPTVGSTPGFKQHLFCQNLALEPCVS